MPEALSRRQMLGSMLKFSAGAAAATAGVALLGPPQPTKLDDKHIENRHFKNRDLVVTREDSIISGCRFDNCGVQIDAPRVAVVSSLFTGGQQRG